MSPASAGMCLLAKRAEWMCGSERRLVGLRRRPRVVLGLTRRRLGALTAPAATTLVARGAVTRSRALPVAATLTAAAGDLGDLGGGVAEGGADFVDLDLEHRALLAGVRLGRPRLEPTGDDDLHALLEGLRDVLRVLAPHLAVEEHRVPVTPLARLTIERARRRGHGELRDGVPRRGEPKLRIGGQVADERDERLSSHGGPPELVGCCACLLYTSPSPRDGLL